MSFRSVKLASFVVIPVLGLLASVGPTSIGMASSESSGDPGIRSEGTGWIRTWGGEQYGAAASHALDGEGNIYVVGDFRETVDLDPGPADVSITANGHVDVYLSKFNASGELEWVLTWGSEDETETHTDHIYAVEVDPWGDIYVTGSIWGGKYDLNPGLPVQEYNAYYSEDAFLSKFNTNGMFLWGHCWGGERGRCTGRALAFDSSGNVHVSGTYEHLVDFDPGAETVEHETYDYDSFVSRFNPDGEFQWVVTSSAEHPEDIAIDHSGNIYVTGSFRNTGDFDPGPDIDERSPNGIIDVFLTRYGPDGEYLWTHTWGGAEGNNSGRAVVVDDSDNVYVGGGFSGSCDFDPGPGTEMRHSLGYGGDAFLCRFNPSGELDWVRTWGVDGLADLVFGITLDQYENIWLTGTIATIMGQASEVYPEEYFPEGFWHGILIMGFRQSGEHFHSWHWGRRGTVEGIYGNGIALHPDVAIYITGGCNGNIDFGPDIGSTNVDYYSSDAFLLKVPLQ